MANKETSKLWRRNPPPLKAHHVQAAAAGDAGVSFPDDYPNSVKHFLLLGAIGMCVP